MSAISNITVFDGQATPVTHTLIGESVSRDAKTQTVTAVWKESLAGVPDYAQVRLKLQATKLPSGVTKVQARVSVPVMESVSGQNAAGYTAAPKVAFEDAAEFTFYASPRSVIAGRRSARQILTNLLGNVSTSVAPATAGFLPEAVDQLIYPT